ncbi:uncharacterized protein B0H18DRAFT_1117158 [Fomitopsis serialis]|uniref:uncharacterized protein n=1 Tax=Fomitopsis serialis TaxID=139415 RepID=UPI0020087A73|nr:uncharacterized protein B0H18DRAFT_1117158 [Neoantrodia serialis]KAH9930099.1 hypothetical protein B0H18DRAFT_1117158 [Neoantrodia serialis]
MFVEKYNESLPCIRRHAPPKQTILLGSHSADTSKLEAKMRERTGTLDFMAIEILETYCAHDIRHDLESFLWLLLWVVLRHTSNTSYPAYGIYLEVFGTQEGWDSAARKRQFLQTWTAFEVKNNMPLTTLIRDFKEVCFDNMPMMRGGKPSATIPLTYESVLAVFDKALADPSWPENDSALPFKLPRNVNSSQPGQDGSAGSRQDEERTSEADDMDRIDDDDPFARMQQRALKRR